MTTVCESPVADVSFSPSHIECVISDAISSPSKAVKRRMPRSRKIEGPSSSITRIATTQGFDNAPTIFITAEFVTHHVRSTERKPSNVIDHLKAMGDSWGPENTDFPNEIAIFNARIIHSKLARYQIVPHRIEPSTGEGVCFSFLNGEDYADIECFNSGDILASISPLNAASSFWDVRSFGFDATLRRIKFFLNNPNP